MGVHMKMEYISDCRSFDAFERWKKAHNVKFAFVSGGKDAAEVTRAFELLDTMSVSFLSMDIASDGADVIFIQKDQKTQERTI